MSINDDGTIARLERERREIIALYDKGVDTNQSKEIPASKIDKYGFFIINDSAAKLSSKDQKKISKSERKWNKMMKNYNVARKYHKFVPRTFKGIPESQRSLVWYKLLDIQILKSTNKGMYLRMRQRGRWKSPEIRQIDLDVNRTFRLNSYFYQRYCQRQQMLFNVLAAYSAYNSEVGYCQGMNNLAAIFTMYLAEEEDVFWGLSQLLTGSKWRMHGFFISGFPKFVRFEKIFNKIISQLLSSLKTHMESLCISSTMYLVKWFMNCYIDVVPFSLTLRIFDVYLMEGESILLAMAFTILHIHKDTLMKLGSIDQILNFLGSSNLAVNFGGISDDRCMIELRANFVLLRKLNLLPSEDSTPEDELPRFPFAPEHSLSKAEIVHRASRNTNCIFNYEDKLAISEAFYRGNQFRRNSDVTSGVYNDSNDSTINMASSIYSDDTLYENYTTRLIPIKLNSQQHDDNRDPDVEESEFTKIMRFPSIYDNNTISNSSNNLINDLYVENDPIKESRFRSKGTEIKLRKMRTKIAHVMIQGATIREYEPYPFIDRSKSPNELDEKSAVFEEYSF